MSASQAPAAERLQQAVGASWENIPPFWQRTRAVIRQVAVEQLNLSVEQFHILRHIHGGQDTVSGLAEARTSGGRTSARRWKHWFSGAWSPARSIRRTAAMPGWL